MPQQLHHLLPLLSLVLLPLFMNKSDGAYNSLCNINFPFKCGNGVNISYPFWPLNVISPSSTFCGYRGLGIYCSSDGQPILTIHNEAYYVKSINYSSNTTTLVDTNLVNQTCPRPTHNVTLSTLQFLNYTPSVQILTFFFNCSSYPLSSSAAQLSPISCLSMGSNRSYVFAETGFDWNPHCEVSVGVPVLMGLNTGYAAALQSGFELDWRTTSNCVLCEGSGGRCGRNRTAREILCFCSNGDMLVGSTATCSQANQGSSLSFGNKLALGFSVAAVAILLICVLFIFRHRQSKGGFFAPVKNKSFTPSSTPLSRNTPSSSSKDLEKGSTYFGVHLFSYDELEEATNNFNSSKELGDGGFGTVYYGKLHDGREVAVKRLYESNYKRVEQFMNEVDILTRLRHQSLVTLYGCTSRHSRELLLVYEFIPNGTVADHLHGDKAEAGLLTWPIRLSIAIETASALSYLHASDIIHRDVKTNNILLDNNFRVKVADFGLSRLFPTDVTHVSTAPQGTPGYVDPEYHQCYQLTDKSDVYSFGVVLIELISSMPAVDISRHRHEINLSNLAIHKIQNQALHELVDPRLGFDSDYAVKKMTTSVAELAFRCLQLEKEMRPSMDEVLQTLKRIEEEDYKVENAEVVIRKENIGFLKHVDPPFSPDSVTSKWVSRSTTPNSSA